MNRVVLDTDVASRSFKRLLPPELLAKLIGREASITFVTQAELTKWAERRQWGPLATLNVKDFRDFAEHDGLTLVTG